jgi:hypothetical protein
VDEVLQYRKARYLSATEAAWRIFNFITSHRSCPVMTIKVHLPGRDRVIYNPGEEDEVDTDMSKLERYFARPPEFTYMRIEEYYHHCILSTNPPPGNRQYWTDNPPNPQVPVNYVYMRVRNADKQVTRLSSMLPTCGEVWYLRLLLKHIPMTSFQDALTITDDNGNIIQQCTTYQEAAIALGLAEAENEGNSAFQEAVDLLRAPNQLRSLLVTLIAGECLSLMVARLHSILHFTHPHIHAYIPL